MWRRGRPVGDLTRSVTAAHSTPSSAGASARSSSARTDGRIEPPSGEGGFGWDASFVPHESSGSSYAELSLEEKNRISHRAAALAQFVAYCREHPEMLQEIELWNTPVAPS